MRSIGETLPYWLKDQGTRHVFGLPGVHTLELYRTLEAAGLQHIGVRHEQGAGFMADGYARASGQPGICLVISGPGVTNIATPLGQAYTDSVPILALSSVNPRADLGMGRGRLHDIVDQSRATAAVTAFSATALTPDQVPALLDRAQSALAAGRPRPVHLSLPLDILEEPWPPSKEARPRPLRRPAPRTELLREAVERIAASRRTVLIVGGGAIEAGPAVAALAEKGRIPVLTTVAAKGVLPDGHRCP